MDIKVLQPKDLNISSFKNDTTVTEGGISLNISNVPSNALTIKSGGLYVGYLSNSSEEEFYISSSGSDSDTGTRDSPFYTLAAAISRIKPNSVLNINLHEGDTFEWRSSWGMLNSVGLNIKAYGNNVDNALLMVGTQNYDSEGDIAYASNNFENPTIKLIVDSNILGYDFLQPRVYSGANPLVYITTFKGINFETYHPSEYGATNVITHSLSKAFFGDRYNNQNYRFVGCKFILGNTYALLNALGASVINLEYCDADVTNGTFLGHTVDTTNATLRIVGGDITNGTPIPDVLDILYYKSTLATASWNTYFRS